MTNQVVPVKELYPATPSQVSSPIQSLETFFDAAQATGLLLPSTVEVVVPKVELLYKPGSPSNITRFLETAIRTAYKSEDKIVRGSDKKIIKLVMSKEHESTLEHLGFTFRVTTSRGVTHELVRHRLASYTQESTRYVNYGRRQPTVVLPWHLLRYNDPAMCQFWQNGMETELKLYLDALDRFKWKAQEARGFLPNDTKTEIVTTMNIRSFRHFCRLRTTPSAHPDMQVIAREVLRQLYTACPILFQDIYENAQHGVM